MLETCNELQVHESQYFSINFHVVSISLLLKNIFRNVLQACFLLLLKNTAKGCCRINHSLLICFFFFFFPFQAMGMCFTRDSFFTFFGFVGLNYCIQIPECTERKINTPHSLRLYLAQSHYPTCLHCFKLSIC